MHASRWSNPATKESDHANKFISMSRRGVGKRGGEWGGLFLDKHSQGAQKSTRTGTCR